MCNYVTYEDHRRYMRKVALIIAGAVAILTFILIFQINRCVAQDSTSFPVGKYKFSLVNIAFGAMIQAGDGAAQLEAIPFVGSGMSFTLKRGQSYGASASALFYMNDKGSLYPMAALGIVLFPKNKIAMSLGWDFGSAPENSYTERLRILINYNLDIF